MLWLYIGIVILCGVSIILNLRMIRLSRKMAMMTGRTVPRPRAWPKPPDHDWECLNVTMPQGFKARCKRCGVTVGTYLRIKDTKGAGPCIRAGLRQPAEQGSG